MDKPDEIIAPWSKEKLDLLQKYLGAYSTIMSRQKWLRGYAYVDAFASVGEYVDRETGLYVDGSPVVALTCEPRFPRLWFIERSPSRLQALRARIDVLAGGRPVNYRQGDANRVLVEEVIPDIPYSGFQRGLVFLDPYGLQVKWDTAARLADARSFDIFMNLSTMGILRLLDRDQRPSDRNQQLLADIMGDTGWMADLYSTQTDLFGEQHHSRASMDHDRVAEIYLAKIKTVFQHVSRPVVMKNSQGAHMYVLFLASHNRTAMAITNDIFRRYERLRMPRR